MEKEYVFVKLSAVQYHMLQGVNVDCRGNMKSVASNYLLVDFTGCIFVYCSCMQNSKWTQGRLTVLERPFLPAKHIPHVSSLYHVPYDLLLLKSQNK